MVLPVLTVALLAGVWVYARESLAADERNRLVRRLEEADRLRLAMISDLKKAHKKLVAEMKKDVAAAEEMAAIIQARFAEIWDRHYAQQYDRFCRDGNLFGELVRRVRDDAPNIVAYVGEPSLTAVDSIESERIYSLRYVRLHRFAIDIGMTPETPPEFVVRKIVGDLQRAILTKWQSQSFLLRGAR